VLLASACDLSPFGFFKRGTVKEFFTFASREIASRTNAGETNSVCHEPTEGIEGFAKFLCHAKVNAAKLGCVVITDGTYPPRAAYGLMNQSIEAMVKEHGDKLSTYTKDAILPCVGVDGLLVRSQKPDEFDAMSKINKDLDETKDIMIRNIDKLLERGEKLEDLAKKSQDLSDSSKLFLRQSEKLNRCCIIV